MLWKRCLVVLALAAAVSATDASAVERIQDGGFEAMTTCVGADCTSSVWSEVGRNVFLCSTGMGFPCNQGAPASGPHWVLFGTGFVDQDPPEESGPALGILEQQVPIPAGPATLSFRLSKPSAIAGQVTLKVRLDGTVILTPGTASLSAYPYTVMSVDVSSFAGTGKHNLRFEFTCVNTCGEVDLDDVSLDAADPASPPALPVTCAGRIATVVGTDQSETVRGTQGNDVIAALGGNDKVKAGRGNDIVCGGAGRDRLRGERGKDRLFGEAGRDNLDGGRGRRDVCDGGDGKDVAGRGCDKIWR